MANFVIEPEILTRFPDYLVLVVFADQVDNNRNVEAARQLLHESVRYVWEQLQVVDPKVRPEIACWRQAFRQLGWSASTYQSSVEALVRRTLKGNPPPSINPAVDLANAASLRFLVPIGAHDWQTVATTLAVRMSRSDDRFLPLGDGETETPDPGEVVYAHETEVRTRRWIWRQSRLGLVTPASHTIFFPIDAFFGVTDHVAQAAAHWLKEQLTTLLGATVTTHTLTRDYPKLKLP